MRLKIVTLTLCCAGVVGSTFLPALRAAEAPVITLPSVDGEAAAGKFSTLQLEYIRGWIKQHVPTCPPDVATAVAERFLEDLRQQSPARFEQIPSADFPLRDYESTLYRHLGAQLSGPANTALREDLARRRVQSMLEKEGTPAATAQREAGELLEKIKEISSVFHRRLLEGRTEDDDLSLQLKRARRPEEAARTAERQPAEKKTLTVTDILSEYARENQQASALQRLRAYTIEGHLRTTTGEEGHITLARMRPDRFRFELSSKDGVQYVLAYDGQRYWQQAPGRPAQVLTRDAVGSRRYLGEFVTLLFGEEKADFERLEDGTVEGKPVYRVAVKRTDGTRYVAHIDTESFRQVGRENEDKTISVYSDFREIAGVTIAFHEQVVDGDRKGTFEITRLVPNPGLIQAFFEPTKPGRIDYFTVQRALQQAAPEEGRKGQ